MAASSGLSGQLGYKSESVYGTAVTVDKFLPVLSESIQNNVERMDSQAVMGGRLVRHKWAPGRQRITGSLEFELGNITIAPLLRHAFGAVATTGAGPYTHTFTPGQLVGKSMTIQVGRPDSAGTVQPFTYAGCKVTEWELGATAGELARMSTGIVAKSEVTATALAVAAYSASWAPFTFIQGALTVAGTPATAIREFRLRGANSLAAERFAIGAATIAEPLDDGRRDITGELVGEFESLTAYNRYVNATETALVLAFSNGTDSLTITMNVRYDGETPNVSGTEMLSQSLPFAPVSSTSDAAAITAVLINSDVSAAT